MNLEEVQPGLYQSTEPSRRVVFTQQYVERLLSLDDPPSEQLAQVLRDVVHDQKIEAKRERIVPPVRLALVVLALVVVVAAVVGFAVGWWPAAVMAVLIWLSAAANLLGTELASLLIR